jgi:hypothetical protein
VPLFGYLAESGPGEFIFHFEAREGIPLIVLRTLDSDLVRAKLTAIWELEAMAMSEEVDTSYRSRAVLQETAADETKEEQVRMAARVAFRLSIPMLEALRKDWVRGPLFDQSDSSIFDRIVAAIEYDGHDNFHMNNDATRLLRAFGLERWNDISEGEKRRFARAVIRSAMNGAFGPQRFLRDSERIPDPWLEAIVDEMASYRMTNHDGLWDNLVVEAAYNPLRVWVRRTTALPDSWRFLLEATLQQVVPAWYRVSSEAQRMLLRQIWQDIGEQLGNPNLIVEFMDLL